MSTDAILLAQAGQPPTTNRPAPARPGVPPPPQPQLVTPAPAPAPQPTPPLPVTRPAITQPARPPEPMWFSPIDVNKPIVQVVLAGLLVSVVAGLLIRGWVMKAYAKKGVDPMMAGGFGTVVWIFIVLAYSFAAVALLWLPFFQYSVFVISYSIAAGVALLAMLIALRLTMGGLRRRRS